MTDATATQPAAIIAADLEPPAAPAAEAPALVGAGAVNATGPAGAAGAGAAKTAASPSSRPRTRWAAIIWGAALAAIAGSALWITVSSERRAALADWTLNLTPAATGAYVVLAIGTLALVAGVVGIARRAQRGITRRRAALGPSGALSGAEEL